MIRAKNPIVEPGVCNCCVHRTKQLSRSIGGVQSNVRALTTDGGLAMLGEAVEGAYAIGDCATITQQKKHYGNQYHSR